MIKYSEYFISDSEGKSNCVIRTFCKILNKDYDTVFNELVNLSKELNQNNFNDVEVFEEYMNRLEINKIDSEEIQIKDLNLDSNTYVVFCYDKKDRYHMAPIIDNVLYDKTSDSLDLYVISLYKSTVK